MNPESNPYPIAAEAVDIADVYFWSTEIGQHTHPEMTITRTLDMGLGRMFGLQNLKNVRFRVLAEKIEKAYKASEGLGDAQHLPQNGAWMSHQFPVLRSWVERKTLGIYDISKSIPEDHRKERFIWIFRHPDNRLELRQGSHRCLALWIIGERKIWAKVSPPEKS